MTAVANLNLSSELNITPSRKRKRQFERQQPVITTSAPSNSFTNAAFTNSTPKKILAKRRLNVAIPTPHNNKENYSNSQVFGSNIGLEVKSIADIVKDTTINPYEVMRKPPKKKKRDEETGCFENPALNLDLPERQFNPFEIVREKTTNSNSNCFVNPALNLKTQDNPASCNPFEIKRDGQSKVILPTMPCKLKIGLPFVPNMGCRIDFKDMSMSQLTPSKLLAEKLVFSPIIKSNKVSLGSIGEETMDIGKELDRYQLELENSINEAKLRKTDVCSEQLVVSPISNTVVIDVEKNIKITHKLTEIKEDGETDDIIEETTESTQQHAEVQIFYEPTAMEESCVRTSTNPFESETLTGETLNHNEHADNKNNPFTEVQSSDLDVLYDGSDNGVELPCDDSFDFKAPAPFVRAYTRPASPKLRVSKESLVCKDNSDKPSDEHAGKSKNVKNLIRKSIRKLMHPNQHKQEETATDVERAETEKHSHGGFINSLRHSLRRKPGRTLLKEEPLDINECELSIIDGSERTMKLKSNLTHTEYVKIEDLTNEKKHNIRNSIRRSTREVGHQFMKTVFHKKHEEYEFNR